MAKTRKPDRPRKPHPDFPLFPHATGRWAKKVRQKLQYFGKVADDPKGEKALAKWLDQKDDLLAGRTPRVARDGLTVAELLNRFLNSKRDRVDTGELSPLSFQELYGTCRRIGDAFGTTRLVVDLDASDFEHLRTAMTNVWGPTRVSNEVQRVRSVFKYAYQAGLIDQPVRYGPNFTLPSRRAIREARNGKGPRMFEAAELRKIIDAAEAPLKAMILLGVNCGFGNADVGRLPMQALDLQTRWVTFPRPKTGVDRRCPLWTETVTAIQEALDTRPNPGKAADKKLLFLDPAGQPWVTITVKPADSTAKTPARHHDGVGLAFTELLKTLGMHRSGLGFYTLRHVHETISGGALDQVATDYVMGHSPRPGDMASVYRERIDDARLRAVTDHVRRWLFGA